MTRLILFFLCISAFAGTKSKYSCENQRKKIFIIKNGNNHIYVKPQGRLGVSMKFSHTSSSGLSVYSSKEGIVKIEFNNGIKKAFTDLKLGGLNRQSFYSCFDLDKVPSRSTKPAPRVVLRKPKPTYKATEKTPARKFSVVRDTSENFQTYGQLSHIKFQPDNSPLDFKYDVAYYIPQKLRGQKNLKTLVFLHGGGESTKTRYRSFKVVLDYSKDLMLMADRLGVVLVLPSASGLNWSSQMLNYLRELNDKLNKELEIDPNKIGLSGHSMGGMGITRSAQWLVDTYSFFLPIAAGIDPKYVTDEYMSTYFNTNYHHLQGLNDHFKVFISRSKKQNQFIRNLEKRESKKTGFKLEFYKGNHNHPLKRMEELLGELFSTVKRELYQKELNAIFYNRDEVLNPKWGNGTPFYLGTRNSYFWLKALTFSKNKKVVSVKAKISSQVISINAGKGIKTLRVYLSSKMINLKKEIRLKVNGVIRFKGIPKLNQDMSKELNRDFRFKFNGYIDINL